MCWTVWDSGRAGSDEKVQCRCFCTRLGPANPFPNRMLASPPCPGILEIVASEGPLLGGGLMAEDKE